MTTTQDSQLRTLLTDLHDLSATWLIQSGEFLARANRLGPCSAGKEAATEASVLRHCARQLSTITTTALTSDSPGPGSELTPADVDVLVITAAELWDLDDTDPDGALSERQREVLAKARAIYAREYAGYENEEN